MFILSSELHSMNYNENAKTFHNQNSGHGKNHKENLMIQS